MAYPKYLKNVVTLSLDPELCNGCRRCETVCPHAVLQVQNGKASITVRDHCMECGACARNCEQGALSVQAGVGCAAAVIGAAFTGAEACSCG